MSSTNIWISDSTTSSIDFGSDFYTINVSDTMPSYSYTNSFPEQTKIKIDGEDADVVINGKSMKTFMEKMEERLAILQPDPAKLEKFEALRKAYENYKLIEKMVNED